MKALENLIRELVLASRAMQPDEFKAMLCGGIIANTIGNLDDAYWQAMMKCEPCDDPECNCQLLSRTVMDAFDVLRRDYFAHKPGMKHFGA